MTYTIDDIIDYLERHLPVADPQQFRREVIDLLRTQLWRRIGYELVGIPYEQPVNLAQNRRVERGEEILSIDDASVDGMNWTAVAGPTHQLGAGNPLTMERDPIGISFPYFRGSLLYLRGRALCTDAAGNALIPSACYAVACEFCLMELLSQHPQHPRFGERGMLDQKVTRLIGDTRAELSRHGSTAADRTVRQYLGNLTAR